MAIYASGYTLPSGLDSNSDIKLLQQYLNNAGYQIDTGATGNWDASTDAAWKKYLEAAGVEGAATENPDIAKVEGAPDAYNTVGLVKAYQRTYGLDETGVWDDATKAKYNENRSLSVMNDELRKYYEDTLAGYNLPTVDKEALQSEIAKYLRPAYDQAIANRKKATEENRALTDIDAYSRGMGASTWVTDAKNRMSGEEASDVSNMESNYAAALTQALLEQLNTNKAQELTAKNNAYTMALQLYNLAQAQRQGQTSSASYGGGGGYGGGGYSYSSGGSSSSGSSRSSSSSSSSGNTWPSMEAVHSAVTKSAAKSNPKDSVAARGSAARDLVTAQASLAKQAAASGDRKTAQYYSHWRPAR